MESGKMRKVILGIIRWQYENNSRIFLSKLYLPWSWPVAGLSSWRRTQSMTLSSKENSSKIYTKITPSFLLIFSIQTLLRGYILPWPWPATVPLPWSCQLKKGIYKRNSRGFIASGFNEFQIIESSKVSNLNSNCGVIHIQYQNLADTDINFSH